MMNQALPSIRPHHLASAIAVLLLLAGGGLPSTAQDPSESGVVADFEGRQIDLAKGWGDAQACLVLSSTTHCFRTIDELTAAEKGFAAGDVGLVSPAATCSTALRLYDGTYQTGSVLSIATRGQWINLGLYGFDNRTSSYRVGACAVELASGTNGGGSRYFRCLNAYCEEDVMASGWDNVLSSAYLK
jgi:hypothetical protein